MANQTLTTGTQLARVNLDSSALSGLNNGENITINGGHLLIDGDTRWGNNGVVVDSLMVSATLGGSILFDGTNVWEVPFSASTGNVPAVSVAGDNPITGTGIAGELFRVWATGSLTPADAAGAMPATGWVKLRSKTGDFSNGLVVTLPGGATITCSGAGKQSWIHIVGEEAGTLNTPRLGAFTTRGGWYELGTTSGADDQTFQYPVADHCPALQIETSAGSGEYEWWLNAGSRWGTATQFVATDVRGKYFGCTDATGIIKIAQRASNACGYKPATGCRVRVANIILSNSTATNYALNTVNATPSTRYDFTATQAGAVDIQNVTSNWGMTFTNAFSVDIKDCAISGFFSANNIASEVNLESIAIGLYGALELTPFLVANCFTSVNLTKVRSVRYASTGSYQSAISLSDVANVTAVDCQAEIFGSLTAITRGNTVCNPFYMVRLVGTNVITRPTIIGGRMNGVTCYNLTVTDTRYADQLNGDTQAVNSIYALDFATGCSNVTIDGFANFAGLPDVNPKLGIVSVSQGSSDFRVLNFGTPDAPYDGGTGMPMERIVSSSVVIGLQIRRLYAINLAVAPLVVANTVQGVVVDNVWGEVSDIQALLGINMVARGCKWINNTSGQSSVYGRHWEDSFISDTEGQFLIAGNEPLAATASQATLTAAPGAGFTSTGNISLGALGDNVEWTMPYFAIGHTGFGQTDIRTPFDFRGNNIHKHSFEYQLDTGSGFGVWKRLTTAIRRSLNGNAGTNFFDADTTSLLPNIGDKVQSTNGRLPYGTTVVSVVGIRVTVSANFTVNLITGETVYAWSEIEDEPAVNPATGVKMKVRATVTTADATNAITYLVVRTKTNAVDQKRQYPLPQTQLTIRGFEAGSDVVVYDATTPADGSGSNVLATGDAVSGSFVFDYNGTPQIKIGVFKGGFVPQVTPLINLTATDSSYTIQQRADRNYS